MPTRKSGKGLVRALIAISAITHAFPAGPGVGQDLSEQFRGGGRYIRSEQAKKLTSLPGECDSGWQPGAPVNGVDGWVGAIAADGAGNVYVGGSISAAGKGLVNNIAKWDGASWSPLGSGVDGLVTAIVTSGTDVYVGGTFTNAGGIAVNAVAKWNGSAWSALGSGPGHTVEDLAISGSTLYAGGTGGPPDHMGVVSIWNGSTWSALGIPFPGGVSDIAVSGSDVYASRDYRNSVFRWNGASWADIA